MISDLEQTAQLVLLDEIKEALEDEKEKPKYFYHFIKNIFDIVCSLIGLIFLIPIAIVVKIAYMLNGDFKSIIYTQDRIGKDGKIFKLYKFRSMIPNADEELKKLLSENESLAQEYKINKKLENDPRVTKIGKIIRKTSIDELPQIINILKQDMSVIGNRPYLPREKEDMGSYYKDIIKTKPGLTGFWQCALRSEGTFEERLKMEKYYSKHYELKMDIGIFFKTIAVVLKTSGAK